MTTIEFCEKRKSIGGDNFTKSPYKISFLKSLEQVFGKRKWIWLLPIAPDYEGKGLMFEVSEEYELYK